MKLNFLGNSIKLSQVLHIHKVFENKYCDIDDGITYIPKSSISHIKANLDNLSKDPKAIGIIYNVTIYYEQGKEITFQAGIEDLKALEKFLS